jgi:uncharacterized protein (UPF0548 family)
MWHRRVGSLAELAAADLTYPEVGVSRDRHAPSGYGTVQRNVIIGSGRPAFERAADGLFSWQMHRGAGFRTTTSAAKAATGVTVVLRVGWRPFQLTIPCRVVYTLEEKYRRGFAYGTLPGHPEQGEEAFIVETSDTGDVRFHVWAFSRPASLLAQTGGPLTHLVQQYATSRYVAAMRDLAHGTTPR